MNAPLPSSLSALAMASLSPLDDETLEARIADLAATIAAATWQLLDLIAEFDSRQAWAGWGILSCAHWLNWKCGIALGCAREKVRVAHALRALPLTSESFRHGQLSYSKVRAMTRVATPENEEFLLMIARHGTAAHVERAVQGYRRALRFEENAKAERCDAQRSVRWHYDDDGMLVLHAVLPAEAGAMVLKALAAASEDLRAERSCEANDNDVPAGTSAPDDPAGARRADALCHLAEQFLNHGPVAMKQADRHQIVVHIDEAVLRHGADGRCEIEQGPTIALETARRLACDAAIVEITEDDAGNVLDIGRKTRAVSPALRRALTARDRGCRFPGCTHTRYVDAHHIEHWANGGATSAENLVLLCRRHHRLLHEGGFSIERRDDGKLLFLRPDGQVVAYTGQIDVPASAIAAELHVAAENVPAGTSLCLWAGERMDLQMVVSGLFQSDRKREDVRVQGWAG